MCNLSSVDVITHTELVLALSWATAHEQLFSDLHAQTQTQPARQNRIELFYSWPLYISIPIRPSVVNFPFCLHTPATYFSYLHIPNFLEFIIYVTTFPCDPSELQTKTESRGTEPRQSTRHRIHTK